jgi:hypothetical protein
VKKLLISLLLGFASLLIIEFYNSPVCIIYNYQEVKRQIRLMETTFKMFESTYGVNPPADNWKNELLGNDKAIINTRKNCYIESTKDSWGNEIRAIIPGNYNKRGVDVFSVGADGISKTNGNDPDDLNTWSPSHNGQYYQRKYDREQITAFILRGLFCSLVAFVFLICGFKTILSIIAGFMIVFILAAAQAYPPFGTGSECPAFLVTLLYSIAVFFLRFKIKACRYTALILAILSFVIVTVRFCHYTMR